MLLVCMRTCATLGKKRKEKLMKTITSIFPLNPADVQTVLYWAQAEGWPGTQISSLLRKRALEGTCGQHRAPGVPSDMLWTVNMSRYYVNISHLYWTCPGTYTARASSCRVIQRTHLFLALPAKYTSIPKRHNATWTEPVKNLKIPIVKTLLLHAGAVCLSMCVHFWQGRN